MKTSYFERVHYPFLNYLWLFLSVVLISLSNILYKYAALSIHSYNLENIITNFLFWICLSIFFARMLIWQKVLTIWPISMAYPLTSVNIVAIYFYGVNVFGEKTNTNQIFGCIMIIIGFLLLFSRNKNNIIINRKINK